MPKKWQIDTPAQIGGLLEAKAGAVVTGDVSISGNGTINGDLNLTTDGKSLNFYQGAKIFKKVGSGLKIQAHNDSMGIAIVDTAGNDKLVIKTDGSTTGLTYNGATVWTSQNHGSGSGLDADKLDGLDSTKFLRNDVDNVGVNADILFNLPNTSYPLAFDLTGLTGGWARGLNVLDNSGTRIAGAGFNGNDQTVSKFAIKLSSEWWTSPTLEVNTTGVLINGNTAWHAGNDGSGSGLDADLLDGIDSTGFLRRNIDTNTTGQVTITRDGDAIVFNKNTTTSYSGLVFNSKTNPNSDFGYIRYYDDSANFDGGIYDIGSSTENSLMVVGVENDTSDTSGDILVLRGGNKVIIDNKSLSGGSAPSNIIEFRNGGTLKSYINVAGKYMGDVDTVDGLHAASFMRSDANTSTTGNVSIGGTLSVSGATNLGANLTINWAGNAGMEIGRTDGTASTPFIDFHSGATATDYDVRLGASGGDGTNGHGYLTIYANQVNATTNASVTNHLAVGTQTVDANRELTVQQSNTTNTNGLAVLASGSGNVGGFFWAGASGFVIDSRANDFTGSKNLHLQTGGTNRLFIDGSTGNIGINTTTPSFKLDVSGSVRFQVSSAPVLQLYRSGSSVNSTIEFKHDGGSVHAGHGENGYFQISNVSDTSTGTFRVQASTGNTRVGDLDVNGVVRSSKLTWQVTFAAGETTKTITHNLGTTNYMCALGANSVARHVAWANKTANTIDVVLDSPYLDSSITVDVILMAY